jgi:hypothetical protein
MIIEYALEALAGVSAADRMVALENIQRIGKAAARAATSWRTNTPSCSSASHRLTRPRDRPAPGLSAHWLMT